MKRTFEAMSGSKFRPDRPGEPLAGESTNQPGTSPDLGELFRVGIVSPSQVELAGGRVEGPSSRGEERIAQ